MSKRVSANVDPSEAGSPAKVSKVVKHKCEASPPCVAANGNPRYFTKISRHYFEIHRLKASPVGMHPPTPPDLVETYSEIEHQRELVRKRRRGRFSHKVSKFYIYL